jgi:hypothetical protein
LIHTGKYVNLCPQDHGGSGSRRRIACGSGSKTLGEDKLMLLEGKNMKIREKKDKKYESNRKKYERSCENWQLTG